MLTAVVVALTTPIDAGVRKTVPEESPHGPLYADWYGDEAWVAFLVYRFPECVNTGFNFLEVFDFPAAFGCPPTVEGFEIYEGPEGPVPKQTHLEANNGLPIWFISRED